jgi:predicted DNA-binding transcriptional regulator YafY
MNGRYEQIGEPGADGWLTIRLTADSLDEARMRVLGLGTFCEVIAPDELHETVLATARAIIQREEKT